MRTALAIVFASAHLDQEEVAAGLAEQLEDLPFFGGGYFPALDEALGAPLLVAGGGACGRLDLEGTPGHAWGWAGDGRVQGDLALLVFEADAGFAPATEIIYEHQGDIDKFIGDCIFATFPGGAQAVAAATRLHEVVAEELGEASPFTIRVEGKADEHEVHELRGPS